MLGLENSEARQIRAEELAASSTMPPVFDVIISRALASLETFFRIALPLLAQGGMVVALKGRVDQQEFDALSDAVTGIPPENGRPGRFTVTTENYVLPIVQSERSVIVIKKGN
jgi:16S rRNA (guanine527-N7)-methyltransferase